MPNHEGKNGQRGPIPRGRSLAVSALALVLLGSLAAASWGQEFLEIALHKVNLPASAKLKGKDQEPPSADQVLSSKRFVFVLGVGGGMQGYDAIRVCADGAGTFVFKRFERRDEEKGTASRHTWWCADFRLTKEELDALRKTVSDNRNLLRKDAYHADVADGTQAFLKLWLTGRRTSVYCNNRFPAEVQRIHEFIKEQFGKKLRAAAETARQISQEDRHGPELVELYSSSWGHVAAQGIESRSATGSP